MPKDLSIKKVLVIGSGPIVIGQAAEFDYAGAQACRVLKSEGVEAVLVNCNPATIMTDFSMANEIYLEPLNTETIKRIILKEKPDSLLAGLGGQTGLTIAMQLSKLRDLYINDAMTAYTLGDIETANKYFESSLKVLDNPVTEKIDSMIVYYTAVTFNMLGDKENAAKYLEK